MNKSERLDDHQKFKELAALAHRGALSDGEQSNLDRHLQDCRSCRQAYDEFALISTEGMRFLASAYGYGQANENWDDRPIRDKLLARIFDVEQEAPRSKKAELLQMPGAFARSHVVRWAALAACVLVAVALGAYHLGGRLPAGVGQANAVPATAQASGRMHDLISERDVSESIIASQKDQLSRLTVQVSTGESEVTRLREALHAVEVRAASLLTANAGQGEQLREVAEQRDKLATQLHDAELSYQLVQTELTNLRADHDRALLHTASLEAKVDELTASARDQDHRLKDDEQFLASDRDIRELMGARKLYIADVFDVDSGSRTRKPFGRVFYTQSKSLIFYAFDLDHEPGVKNASAFQVWGERDTETGVKKRATNLGILYMDSESNRRWVLRLDDPKQVAEIDAVFVTVEPHGGSQKPTGKPFLYALLRREANHP